MKRLYKHFLTSTVAIILLFFTGQVVNATIQITKKEKTITISGDLPGDPGVIEIRFSSTRNQSISSYLQISKNNPNPAEMKETYKDANWDIFYPVVDIIPKESMRGVATFNNNSNALYSVNGMFNEALFIKKGNEVFIDNEYLLNWENSVYIESEGAQMTAFYLMDKIKVNKDVDVTYELLSESWSGEITVYSAKDNKEIARVSVEDEFKNPYEGSLSKFEDGGLSRERLNASLIATLNYSIRSQDQSKYSKTKNGLYLFYDKEAKTYRRSTWVWGWGPSIKMLLESASLPEVTNAIPLTTLIQSAVEIGETSLKFQITDPSSPAYGIIMSRWSENKGTLTENYGFEEYYSIADAQFLAGWGWIPLYKATKDVRYLEGAKLLTETTGKLTNEFDILPMDYMVRAGKWKDYSLNEQGFGTEGINELFKVDPDPTYQQIGDEYMKMLLKKFDTESGIWNRMYWISENEPVPAAFHTRGVGWAMEGLLALYELTESPMYLEKCEKMAQHLVDNQMPDGSWSYNFKVQNKNEISEKGTALWSLLFYKLYDFTSDKKYLSVARKSLEWCLDNQYDGPDMHAHGGLVAITRQSGVVYRQYFPLTCSYASGFFGLAVLEELKIQGNDSAK